MVGVTQAAILAGSKGPRLAGCLNGRPKPLQGRTENGGGYVDESAARVGQALTADDIIGTASS